jgi:hypothetical protein
MDKGYFKGHGQGLFLSKIFFGKIDNSGVYFVAHIIENLKIFNKFNTMCLAHYLKF